MPLSCRVLLRGVPLSCHVLPCGHSLQCAQYAGGFLMVGLAGGGICCEEATPGWPHDSHATRLPCHPQPTKPPRPPLPQVDFLSTKNGTELLWDAVELVINSGVDAELLAALNDTATIGEHELLLRGGTAAGTRP